MTTYTFEEIKQIKFGKGQSSRWFSQSWKNEIKENSPQSEWFFDRHKFIVQSFDRYGNPIK